MATVEETPGSELAALHIDANAETEQTIPVPVDAIGKLVQCPICMGILKETRTISACMHRFCKNCIEAWLRTDITNTCPQCREGFASRRDCKPDPRFDDLLRAILGNDLAAAEALFDPQAESLEKAKALGNVLASQRQAQKVAAQRMAAKARAASVPINAVTPVNGNGETNVASMPSHKRPASGTGDGSTKRRKGGRQTPNTARSLDSQEPEEIAALNPTVPHHVSQNHAAKARATAAAAARAEKTVEENQRGYLIAMKLAEKYPDKDALGPRAPNSAAIMELRPTGILIDNPVLAWRRRFVLCPADLTLQLLAEAIVAGLKDQWQADLMTEIEMNSKFREQESLLSSLQKAPLSATLYLASEVDGTADFGEVCHVPDTQTGAMALKGGVKVRDLMYMLADCGEDLVLEYSLVVGASGIAASRVSRPVAVLAPFPGANQAESTTANLKKLSLITAIKTPYLPNGKFDLDAYDRLVTDQIAHGVQGLIVGGTTGEGHLMSWDEHIMLIAHTVNQFGRDIKVIGNTGSNSTAEALHATEQGFAVGMHAALQINPYYGKTSMPGLLHHFKAVLEEGPAIVYNVPGRTGQDIPDDIIMQIADHTNFLGVKECTGNPRIQSYFDKGVTCWSGNDDEAHQGRHEFNSQGVISVTSNLIPGLFNSLMNTRDDEMNNKLQDLMAWLFCEPNPIALNTALSMCGLIQPVFRLPYVPLSREQRVRGKELLEGVREHLPGVAEIRVMEDDEFLLVAP